jgi:hypothetical protein
VPLLFHRDKASNEVRCELSCPVKMDEDGQINAWAERIILPSIPFGGDSVEGSDVSKTPQINVKIRRKKRAKLGQVFNPSRLTVARKRTGLTKIEFATRAGVPLRSFKETTDNNESFV